MSGLTLTPTLTLALVLSLSLTLVLSLTLAVSPIAVEGQHPCFLCRVRANGEALGFVFEPESTARG